MTLLAATRSCPCVIAVAPVRFGAHRTLWRWKARHLALRSVAGTRAASARPRAPDSVSSVARHKPVLQPPRYREFPLLQTRAVAERINRGQRPQVISDRRANRKPRPQVERTAAAAMSRQHFEPTTRHLRLKTVRTIGAKRRPLQQDMRRGDLRKIRIADEWRAVNHAGSRTSDQHRRVSRHREP